MWSIYSQNALAIKITFVHCCDKSDFKCGHSFAHSMSLIKVVLGQYRLWTEPMNHKYIYCRNPRIHRWWNCSEVTCVKWHVTENGYYSCWYNTVQIVLNSYFTCCRFEFFSLTYACFNDNKRYFFMTFAYAHVLKHIVITMNRITQ